MALDEHCSFLGGDSSVDYSSVMVPSAVRAWIIGLDCFSVMMHYIS